MEEKKQTLKQFLSGISKSLDTPIAQMKDQDSVEVEAIHTGSYSLDAALGCGGWPKGRLIEIFGKESGGKTLISLLAIAEVQRRGGVAAFIDVEHSFDPKWAAKLGVNVDELVFVQPDKGGEQALTVVEELVNGDLIDLIVLDSVAGLVPQAVLDAELIDQQMGAQARMMSKAMPRLVSKMNKSKAIVIFINQVRETMAMYGEKETTPGGKALKFYASVRVAVKRLTQSEVKGENGDIAGHTVHITVKKNKVGAPFREAEFNLLYESGVDRVAELATLAVTNGVIVQAGAVYTFKEHKWKGGEAIVEALRANEALQKDLWAAIKEATK